MHVREWLDIHKGNGGVREDTVQTYKHDIGTISMHGDQKRIKLRDTGDDKQDWYPYTRYVYENYHNVKLPKNYQVICLDGNIENDSIDNLVAVNHQEHAILTAYKWHKKGEITRTGVECARLSILLKDACCKTNKAMI